jgi:hypothetical protein
MNNDIIRIRALVDTPEEEDVFRDIEIYSNQTFLELHSAIQEAFNFDQSQLASFHLSDNDWERGEEITLIDMGGGEKQLMEDTALSDHIRSKNQKLLYIFDFMLMWTFFIEVVAIYPRKTDRVLPEIVLSVGNHPDQYAKKPENLFGAMQYPEDPETE